MRAPIIALAILFIVLIPQEASGQGEAAMPFLLISPSTQANGMGEASVAVPTDDPLAFMGNPAHLGRQDSALRFSAAYNHFPWLPRFQQSDLSVKSFGVNGGVNLNKQFGFGADLSVGLAYSHFNINLGTFNETSPDGPDVIVSYEAWESSDQYAIGLGFSTWIDVSAGVTLKHAVSNLAPPGGVQGVPVSGAVKSNMVDYGFFIRIPAIGIASRLNGSPVEIAHSISPVVDVTVGMARNNVTSSSVAYYDSLARDPLPRYARAGIGLTLGIAYEGGSAMLRPFTFHGTVESNELLVRRSTVGWEYQSGWGDIKFFDELIGGNTSPRTIRKTGWELDLFEIMAIRRGRFEEDPSRGGRIFSTSGLGFRTAGIARILRSSNAQLPESGFAGFLLDHVDLRYDRSSLSTDKSNHPLDATHCDAFMLVVSF